MLREENLRVKEINLSSRTGLVGSRSLDGSALGDVDCVIVTFNSLGVIDDCLTSLMEAGVREEKVFIVDNDSSDGTIPYVARCYPKANIIRSSTNTGFSRANNLGAQEGSSGVLLFANPDLIFLPGAAGELVAGLTSSDTAGICGPLLVDRSLSPKPESYPLPSSLSGVFLLYTYLWKPVYLARKLLDQVVRPESPRKRTVLSGSCMAIRREDFVRVGGFDEEFFMYAEDMDLCEKVSRSGLEVLQIPKARVIHLGGGTYTGSRSVLFNSLKSRDRLILKHSDPLSLVAKRLLILLGLSLRLTAYSVLYKAGRREHRQLLSNLRDGLRPFLSRRLLSRKLLDFPPR